MIGRKVVLVLFLLGIVSVSLVFLNNSVNAQCFGFFRDGICYNIGDELRIDGVYYYVNQNGELLEQLPDGLSCNNNFECINNLCANRKCVNLYEEVRENRGLIEGISEAEIDLEQNYDLVISVTTTTDEYIVNEVINLK